MGARTQQSIQSTSDDLDEGYCVGMYTVAFATYSLDTQGTHSSLQSYRNVPLVNNSLKIRISIIDP
jgi:hypothetical protein